MENKPKLSIVIPCYNEAASLPDLLRVYAEVIEDNKIEIILVNNGSTDSSREVLSQLEMDYKHFLRVVTVETNRGYGYGIRKGLQVATGTFLGWTHGDLQTPPVDILEAFEIIKKHNYNDTLYIKGTRTGRSFMDTFFTFGMSIFETIHLKTILWDVHAQPNIFHKKFTDTWQNPPDDFSLDLYALYNAKKNGLDLVRFPVNFLSRTHGVSSWNKNILSRYAFIKRTIRSSVQLKKNIR